jgi:hypothetical protein
MMKKTFALVMTATACACATAGIVQDRHGNQGFDTAAECDAAVNAGTVRFYQSFTHKPPLLRAGEASVKSMPLGAINIQSNVITTQDFRASDYTKGACDIGAPRKDGRDGVAKELQGKYVPYSPSMPINVYYNKTGVPVRLTMKQCDNWFNGNWPRPVATLVPVRQSVVPASVPVAIAPTPTPAVVVTPSIAPPASVPVAVAPPTVLPVVTRGIAAVTAAQGGGVSTTAIIGAAALIAIPLVLSSKNTSATTGTR